MQKMKKRSAAQMLRKTLTLGAAALALGALSCLAQSSKAPDATVSPSPDQAQILKTTEAFVRNLFSWGPDFKLKVGPLTQSTASNFYEVPLEVTFNDRTDTGEVFVSKDGKTLFRGEMFDMATDPYAAGRAKMHIEGNPAKGPADARVTLVEFGDFECPNCRQLEPVLKSLFEKYKLRLIFKDFPLEQLHPWAKTAAIGGRCAFMQSPDAFWKVHDAIYENQESITPENVWDKLNGFAAQAGLNAEAFKSCLSAPEAAKAVEANQQDGVALNVSGTPTVFVNGRPVAGGDPNALQQLIEFELAAQSK
jgi:protein-disulfide isomerase